TRVAIDPALVIPDHSLSLDDGAVVPWGPDVSSKTNWAHGFRGQIIKHLGISTKKAFKALPKRQQQELLWGTAGKKYQVKWSGKTGQGSFEVEWEGLIPRLMRRFSATKSERAKQWYARFVGDAQCATCGGARLRA